MKKNYQHTMVACFMGYIVQAIINNFAPLLFLTFQNTWSLPLSKITFFVTMNFSVQLLVDLISVRFVDRIGYRASMVLAHGLSAAGLILMATLPQLLPNPYIGLLISIVIYAIGGGLLEVIVSPIVEACPTENKETAMSLLHSFYCWGHVGVVLLSTAFFLLFGVENWRILSVLWAVVPLVNLFVFLRVPIPTLLAAEEQPTPLGKLAASGVFWLMLLLMVCAGASEQAVSQWASTFAEKGLGVSKAVGDLAGPMLFAVLMGTSRALYGKLGSRLPLRVCMFASGLLCIFSYLLIALSPWPVLALAGCGLCGFSVGIFWPGSFSIAAASMPKGGTAMFALLALAGDLGCSSGPTVVGLFSGLFHDSLNAGIACALIFPILLLVGLSLVPKQQKI